MKSRRYPVSSDRRYKDTTLSDFHDSAFVCDRGPAERWQHAGCLFELADTRGVLASRTIEESILDILVLQNHITPRHLAAALRLKTEYLKAGLSPHLVGSYNPARVGSAYYVGCDDRSDEQEEAYQSWRMAIDEVGEMLSDVVITVVCHDIAPHQNLILPLQIGLIRLVRFYGLSDLDDDVDQASAREVGAWSRSGRGGESRRRRRLLH